MSMLNGRVALITGASRGIGAATARTLASAGAQVALASRSGDNPGIEGAFARACDVRDPGSLETMAAATVERFGRLDILVVNAGVGAYGPFLDLPVDDIEEMIEVNVKGAIYAVRAALPHLLRSEAADIVTIASEAGRRGLPYEATYCASKFAQVGLTRALDHELREQGVRCTSVCPGGVATDFAMGHGRTRDMPQLTGMMSAQDVAETVLFVVTRPRTHRILEIAFRPVTETSWMSEMTELRWGILSTANIAREKVIPGIQRAARCRVVAIASRDGARANEVAREAGIPTAHGSYEALLADPTVDAVYIPLPNHLHAEWTIAAARAGKHILCEKPLAMTSADAERMIAAAEGAGVRLMEAFMYRLHPSWVAVRGLVAAGRIGRLVAVQSWFSYFNDDPANIRNVRAFGGGALFDVGCYSVNLSRMLFGSEPLRVEASVLRDPSSGVDVLTSGLLEFEGGGVATFTCSTRAEDDQRVHIYGTEGRISIRIPFNIPPDRPTYVDLTHGGEPPVSPATETLTFEAAGPYAVEAEAFAAAVLDGRPTPVPPADAVANLRVIERIFEAGTPGPDR